VTREHYDRLRIYQRVCDHQPVTDSTDSSATESCNQPDDNKTDYYTTPFFVAGRLCVPWGCRFSTGYFHTVIWRDSATNLHNCASVQDDSPCRVLISTQAEYAPQGLTPRGMPRGVTARPSWIVSTRANTPQGERKDAKHAKFGENRKIFF